MRKFIFVLLVIMSLVPLVHAKEGTDIKAGMSLQEFRKIYPNMPNEPTHQWQRSAPFHGVNGKWTYDFKNGVLDWFACEMFDETPTRADFKRYLIVAQSIIGEYQDTFGAAQSMKHGKKVFVDPRKEPHRGYAVLSADWTLPQQKLEVSYDFAGVRGNYRLVIEVMFKRKK